MIGARLLDGDRCSFTVWAPHAREVEVHLVGDQERVERLAPADNGYHRGVIEGVAPGALYRFRLDGGEEYPDPASLAQPEGVHGPSQVVAVDHEWQDTGWAGLSLADYVFYELHVGTFTADGSLDAVIGHLDSLRDLGVTALELMPVAEFPGRRNWGYDGVYPFAVHHDYAGLHGLMRLVDACHRRHLALVLDVVYNHLGPEGNYLANYAPYFTDRYRTPWGPAVNFDGPGSDEVRRYFIENALFLFAECHVDALRLDAVHAIFDLAPSTFLEELAARIREWSHGAGRRVHLIAESNRNDPRIVRSPSSGGWGLDAQWNDDFHHALHAVLTGERSGYYQDFGRLEQLAKAQRDGFVYTGEYSSYRRRRHGRPCHDLPDESFVVFAQNHDQVGNRAGGDRLIAQVGFEAAKLAAGMVVLSPCLPLLFMGEEYGESAPFPYFVSHGDPQLVEAVRRGRREEFAAFEWAGDIPDPAAQETFLAARLNHDLAARGRHRQMREFYRTLLRLRRDVPALARPAREKTEVQCREGERLLVVRRANGDDEVVLLAHFDGGPLQTELTLPAGEWRTVLDSTAEAWGGPGGGGPAELPSGAPVSVLLPPWSLRVVRKGSAG
jgi:maltooligosyltrehalose trehalohydrolase